MSVLGGMHQRRPRIAGHELIDAVFDGYVTWRERAAAVGLAYRDWTSAAAEDRARAYAVYVSALDREEHAAAVYCALVKQAELTALDAGFAPI